MASLRLMLAAGLLAALSPAAAQQTPAAQQTLRVASATGFSTFNPFLAYFQGDLDIVGDIYPSLTRPGPDGTPLPYLATKWTVSKDQLTWTFTIRKNLRWSDGTPITAADVAWTYNLVLTNAEAATANGELLANYRSVTAPDASTLIVITKRPQADLLDTSIPVVPEHIWQHLSVTTMNTTAPIVGYGPWTLTGYVPGQYATLTANRDFYLGAPKFGALIDQYYSSEDAAVAALRSGQLDAIGGTLTATQYQALSGDAGRIGRYPTAPAGWTAVEINPGARTQSGTPLGDGNPALSDPRVREAIALAIDRPMLAGRVLDGLGAPGGAYLPPAFPQWRWTPASPQAYDPAKARELLDEAGYRTGRPLTLRLGIHSDLAADAQIAPYLQEWLAAVGIKVTIESMSFAQLNSVLPKGDWDMLMDDWATGPDPSYLLSVQTCAALPGQASPGDTDAFFCDPAYDKLYGDQLTQFDQATRARTVDEMQQILYDADTDVILYYPDALNAVRTDRVRNFIQGDPQGGFYPVQDTFDDWRLATPVTGGAGGDGSAPFWTMIFLIITAGAIVAVTLRRRATRDERE
ncbi:MAG: ABC transporter substrate-binding protein [Streptosporangiaceae bacterium]